MSDSSARKVLEAASRVELVTFFEDRAEVHRRAQIDAPVGVHRVAVPGVSLVIDDGSLQASVSSGHGRVLSSRVERATRGVRAASPDELRALEDRLAAQRAACEAVERQIGRLAAEASRHEALRRSLHEAIVRTPSPAEVAGLREAHRALREAEGSLLDRVAQARADQQREADALSQLEARLSQGRVETPRHEAHLVLELEVTAEGPLSLSLTYRVPCALWRPEHVAMLDDEGGERRLTIVSHAAVWQITGEAFDNVRCRFSTARPARDARAPALGDDVLHLREKSAHERRHVVVEQRDQNIATAGKGRGDGGDMPGVDDGGEPLWIEPEARLTLASDGQLVRVPIGERTMPCEVELTAMPERSEAVHLRAQATLPGPGLLLAGPVHAVVRGAFMGLSKTMLVAPGDRFELGLGVDDALRLVRKVEEKGEQTPIIGTKRITRKVRLYASNLGGSPRRLTAVERVPVSEIKDVEVTLLDAGGAQFDAKDGLLRFSIELGAGDTREISYSYRIEAASNVVLPF